MRVRTEEYKKKAKEYARIFREKDPELYRERVRRSRQRALSSDPDFHHKKDLVRFYGVTHEWYAKTLERQNFACAICKKPAEQNTTRDGKALRLSVDHCHDTGKVRGLLCNNCNRAIGLMSDNEEILIAAANYICGNRN